MFRVPSTPDGHRGSRNDIPSTTPAGPPPTNFTAQSFTPAGAPPSSVFGSSFPGGSTSFPNSNPAFGPSGHLNSPSLKAPLHTNPFGSQKQSGGGSKGGFAVPSSSPPRSDSGEDDGDADEDEDAEDDGFSDGQEDGEGMEVGPQNGVSGNSTQGAQHQSIESGHDLDSFLDSTRGAKRSRNGDIVRSPLRGSRIDQALFSRDSVLPSIAKGIARSVRKPSSIEDPDDVVLHTEDILCTLDDAINSRPESEILSRVEYAVKELNREWTKSTKTQSLPAAIGPKDWSGFSRANYLASLLFSLHHPASSTESGANLEKSTIRSLQSTSLARPSTTTTLPKALLGWLNTHHNPYPEDLPEVANYKPSSTAHERFWDTIYSCVLRGKIDQAINLLEDADFAHADTALEDGSDEPGYKGRQLEAVNLVVSDAIELLRSCPAYTDGDWDLRNTDWSLFRNQVRRTVSNLESYAEENSADREDAANSANIFQSSRSGMSRDSMSFSTASRRAESKVPWTIYEQLKTLYGQLQGFREEILLSSQDWLEASIYLTAWWDGEDEDQPKGGLAASRRSLHQSQRTRHVDVSPLSAYRRRLLSSFASVTDEPEDAVLGVNTVDPVQVGLACVCEDNVEGVIGMLEGWSMPVATAVVDVASAGGWLPQGRPRSRGFMDGLDQSDLMVLSHGQPKEEGLMRDDVLSQYAALLEKKTEFATKERRAVTEGWELACRVLRRFDDEQLAKAKIGELFGRMDMESSSRVEKALAVCNDLGFAEQARSISERYANGLAETSQAYGDAIVYYAKARSVQQLRSTIDLLISMSLVRSAVYPPQDALDDQLESLLNDQRNTLHRISKVDLEAAQLIASHLSGYALLRRFYELRDENDDDEDGPRSGLRPMARKREASKAILGLVQSAADSINGGLFDAEADAVVQIDTLLTLLGEALPLLSQPKPLVKGQQLMSLLRAVEDLQTVTPRVYEQAEALFDAAMADYNGSKTNSPQDLANNLSKSTSNLSASTYAMVNSHGSIESAGRDDHHSEKVYRGWDWRKGIALMAGKNAKGSDVIRILRVQIAKELAQSWAQTP